MEVNAVKRPFTERKKRCRVRTSNVMKTGCGQTLNIRSAVSEVRHSIFETYSTSCPAAAKQSHGSKCWVKARTRM
jgi:hypothetical protein